MPTQDEKQIAELFKEVDTIVANREQDKALGVEVRAQGKALTAMAVKLTNMSDKLQELGAPGNIEETIGLLYEWAELMAPGAVSTTWDKDSMAATLDKLSAHRTLGHFSAEDIAHLEEVTEKLKVTKGGGERAERVPQKPIEGRPATVQVIAPDGTVVSTQSGNLPNSAPNLKTAACNYIAKATATTVDGVTTKGEVSAEEQKGLLAAAKEVAEGRKTSDSFQDITFQVKA